MISLANYTNIIKFIK